MQQIGHCLMSKNVLSIYVWFQVHLLQMSKTTSYSTFLYVFRFPCLESTDVISLLLLVASIAVLVLGILGVLQPNFTVLGAVALVFESLAIMSIIVALLLTPMEALVLPSVPVFTFPAFLVAMSTAGLVRVLVIVITPVILFELKKRGVVGECEWTEICL